MAGLDDPRGPRARVGSGLLPAEQGTGEIVPACFHGRPGWAPLNWLQGTCEEPHKLALFKGDGCS